MNNFAKTESVEQWALQNWFDAASAQATSSYDWSCERIGDALCYVSSSEPSILVNRVLEIGSQAPPTVGQLVEIRKLYRDAGVSRFFLHLIPDLLGPGRHDLPAEAGILTTEART